MSSSSPTAAELAAWREVALEDRRNGMDEVAEAIAQKKQASLQSRKALRDRTRAFRALPEKTDASIGSVIKAYQAEVDTLTKRAAFAESSFLELYRALHAAPDPVRAYEAALEAGKKAQADESMATELEALRSKLEEYDAEFAKLKNQDLTIRRLEEEKHEAELRAQAQAEALADAVRAQWDAEREERKQAFHETERALQQQLEHARDQQRRAESAHEVTKAALFDAEARLEQLEAGNESGSQMLSDDLERTNALVEALRSENRKLREAAEEARASVETDPQTAELQSLLDATKEQLLRAETRIQEEQERSGAQAEQYEAALRERDEACAEAEHKARALQLQIETLPSRETYAELQKKCAVLESLYEPQSQRQQPHQDQQQQKPHDQAEGILVKRCRRLDTELTQVKVRLMQRDEELERAQGECRELQASLAEKDEQLRSLESDLQRSVGDDDPELLLQTVCSQRDRYRAAADRLEAENRQLQDADTELRRDLEALRADNVKLYETLQYVKNYGGGDGGGGGGGGGDRRHNSGGNSHGNSSKNNAERKYAGIYEEERNPFKEFRRQQRDVRYNKLSAQEKITLNVGRFLLGRRPVRSCIFFYVIALHLLVLFTIYFHTIDTHCH